jgi:hypothetical protein
MYFIDSHKHGKSNTGHKWIAADTHSGILFSAGVILGCRSYRVCKSRQKLHYVLERPTKIPV